MPRAFAMVVCALGAACAGERGPAVDVRLGVSPTPATVGPARLVVTVGDTPDVGGAEEVQLVVTGPRSPGDGTVSGVVVTPEPAAGGDYVVPTFEFTTPGEWSVSVLVTFADGRHVERSFPIRVVGPLRTAPGNR